MLVFVLGFSMCCYIVYLLLLINNFYPNLAYFLACEFNTDVGESFSVCMCSSVCMAACVL